MTRSRGEQAGSLLFAQCRFCGESLPSKLTRDRKWSIISGCFFLCSNHLFLFNFPIIQDFFNSLAQFVTRALYNGSMVASAPRGQACLSISSQFGLNCPPSLPTRAAGRLSGINSDELYLRRKIIRLAVC